MRRSLIVLVVMMAVGLAACGSTKVVNQQKTVVYKGSIYNITSVERISSTLESVSADGTTKDMNPVSKDEFKQLTEAGAMLTVSSTIIMGNETIPLETRQVKSWGDLQKMRSNRDDVMKKIQKFMSNSKKSQLKMD